MGELRVASCEESGVNAQRLECADASQRSRCRDANRGLRRSNKERELALAHSKRFALHCSHQ
jgi:hypothetical protein